MLSLLLLLSSRKVAGVAGVIIQIKLGLRVLTKSEVKSDYSSSLLHGCDVSAALNSCFLIGFGLEGISFNC